ncbi:MFS transporter [Deinococcus depolymerans]|uniref:MFS transporter n=1 Tax=Deinococcus depolymerans TaxID=392408 RepID=A0ABP3M2L8_9DEIO
MNDRPTRLRLPDDAVAAPPPDTQTVDQVIEHLRLGPFQYRLLLICGLTFAADAMAVLVMGFALPGVQAHFGLSAGSLTSTLLTVATFAGMLIGAPLWGRMADRLGRRPVFLTTVTMGVVFGMLGAFAPNVWVLLAARVLTGFAIGGTMPVDYALMAEFMPAALRGRFLVIVDGCWVIGTVLLTLVAATTGAWLTAGDGWRWLLALTALPGVVGLFVRLGVPDSPRWLAARGRLEEARAALAQVALLNRRALPPQPLAPPLPASRRASRFAALFGPALRDRLFLLGAAWFGMSLGYYGVFSWLPTYLRANGFALSETYATTLLLAAAQVPGYLLSSLLVEWVGRRATLVGFMLLSALGAYLFLLAATPTAVLLTSALLSFSLLGTWGALYAYTPELFPTLLRASGMGMVSAFARLGSLISPFAGALLLGGQLVQALTVFAALFALSAACVWAVGIETRGQPLRDRETA